MLWKLTDIQDTDCGRSGELLLTDIDDQIILMNVHVFSSIFIYRKATQNKYAREILLLFLNLMI